MDMPGYGSPPEDPNGIQAIVDGRFVNVGSVKTDGLEGSIQYSTDAAGGTISAGVLGAYVLSYGRAIFPAEPIREVVNTYGNPARFRLRGNLEYTTDSLTAVTYVNHTGGYVNDTVTPAADVPSYTTFDLSFRYRVKPGFLAINEVELSLDVQNVFDRDPPIVLTPTPLPYDGQVASLLGRNILVGLRTRW
jgi:iron complex outermembrane receptor protein